MHRLNTPIGTHDNKTEQCGGRRDTAEETGNNGSKVSDSDSGAPGTDRKLSAFIKETAFRQLVTAGMVSQSPNEF